jgi:hypothetical protein
VERALGDRVGDLAAHRRDVLAAREPEHAAAGTGRVVAGREALGQQHDATDVGGPAPVELGRGDGRQRLGRATGVHGHEDVEGAVPVDDAVDQGAGHVGVLEVVFLDRVPAGLRPAGPVGVRAPRHLGVVRPPSGGDHGGAQRGQAVGHRPADALAPGNAGDKCHSAREARIAGLGVHAVESTAPARAAENRLVAPPPTGRIWCSRREQ